MSEWRMLKLSELGEVNRGRSRHRPRDAAHLYGGPYPFIQTGDVKASNGRITSYTQTYSEAGLKQSRLWPANTMCITIAANIAETGILSFPACFPDSVIGFIADEEKADVKFIEYAFRLLKRRLQHEATGSVQDNINLQTLDRLEIPVPSLETQRAIAHILGDLDDKIELNNNINQTLEQTAQTIFRSWFVDFEPVKAKDEANAAGRDPEHAAMCAISGKTEAELDQLPLEQRQQLAATAALFPDELVESELGLIPQGWEVQRVESILELSYGKSLTKTERKDGYFPVYGSGGITGCHDKPLVAGPGIIVGRKGTVGASYWEDRDFFAIDTVFYVEPKNGATLEVLFYLLQTLGLEKMNTDAAVPGLNRNNVYRLPVPKYPEELMEAFSETVGAIREKIFCGLGEIETLATLRDTLLPKLLSGELRPPLVPPMK